MPEASALAAPWPFSAAASMPTPSAWWAAGVPTRCFDTCMPKLFPSSGASAGLCSPMAPTPYSRALTSRSPLHSSSWRLRHRLTANPPTHPPMAGMAQESKGAGGRLPVKLVSATLTPSLSHYLHRLGCRTTSYIGGD